MPRCLVPMPMVPCGNSDDRVDGGDVGLFETLLYFPLILDSVEKTKPDPEEQDRESGHRGHEDREQGSWGGRRDPGEHLPLQTPTHAVGRGFPQLGDGGIK